MNPSIQDPNAAPPPIMVDYIVMVEDGVYAKNGEVFQKGNLIQFADGDQDAVALLADKSIMLKSDFDALPKTAPVTTPPVAPPGVAVASISKDPNAEPRKRYRGHVVISESQRTVGAQTFNHIGIADGTEYDLTDKEYAAEVHVSYPPQA